MLPMALATGVCALFVIAMGVAPNYFLDNLP